MRNSESYRTLEPDPDRPPVHIAKKSKFIAEGGSVSSEAEASDFLKAIRLKYPDASHHVYAYRIGSMEKYSDDGEPGGTAGMPVLIFMRGENLQNSIIIVIRYFGGTLLGTGGLTHAYGGSARLLRDSIVEKVLHRRFTVTVDYSFSGRLRYDLEQAGSESDYIIHDIIYTENVSFITSAAREQADGMLGMIKDATNGSAVITENESIYISRRP